MENPNNEFLHGTLELLILKTVESAPLHGYAIARRLEEATADALRIEEGSLYPALYRLERRRWLEAEWGRSELGRKAKMYRITPRGREHLEAQIAEWAIFSAAVSAVLVPS